MSNRSEPVPVTPDLLRGWGLPDPGASKNSRGRVFVVGGSMVSAGGVVLSGEAALRVGAGKVGVATTPDVAGVVRTTFIEAGVYEWPAGTKRAPRGWEAEIDAADAILVGPGLDDAAHARARLEAIAAREVRCLVVDAFAVGALPEIDRGRLPETLIINANLDEAALVLGREVDDPMRDAVEIAQTWDAVVHCYSAVAAPSGQRWRLDVGGAGLGTAGSGDVLAGAIAGFAARGVTPERAAVFGAWCHGRAGDRLSARLGLGFLARELVRELPAALTEIAPHAARAADQNEDHDRDENPQERNT